ncbi:pyruvate ferredoxin oxidoreductase [bacterium]|nr:pyruvate ferredoxin oxidoreductase [bacterium]
MKKITQSLTGNEAAALALRQVEPDVLAIYPITPTTEIMQIISHYVERKKMRSELILAESEHSAMSACVGASASGVRTATASASQGLIYMHEILPIASGLRLPVVMVVGNRAISAPINIHGDHSDTMAVKDSGWLQLYAENPQEVYDLIINAFPIAEKARLPVMICMDGFITTHELAKIETLPDKEVKKIVGPFVPKNHLFNKKPVTIGHLALPDSYMELKLSVAKAIKEAKKTIEITFAKFNHLYKTSYSFIEVVNPEAKTFLVAMSSVCGTVKEYIQKHPEIGLLKLRCFRPFPKYEIIKALEKTDKIIVLDRAEAMKGDKGHLYEEVRSALYDLEKKPLVFGEIYGLGGRDFYPQDLEKIISRYA